MAEKTKNGPQEKVVYKTMNEMSDGEFLKLVEPMGAPCYFDYMVAPLREDVTVSGYLSETKLEQLARNARYPVPETQKPVADSQKSVKNKKYVSKRGVLLLLIALLCVGLIAVLLLGSLQVPFRSYFAVFDREAGDMSFADVATGMVEHLAKIELRSNFAPYFDELSSKEEYIAPYAVSVASILFAVCVVLMLIKAVIALCDRRSPAGYFTKRKFGFLAIVAFLCALIVLVGGIYASGKGIGGIVDFVKPGAHSFGAGIGLYVMILAPIVILIFSSVSYGKKRK